MATAGCFALASGVANARDLVADGSFERPAVPAGAETTFSLGSTLGSWTVVGSPGNVALVGAGFARDGFAFPAADGRQWLDLSGTSGTATGVAQRVATMPGRSYVLRFSVGKVDDAGGAFGRTTTVRVLVDGALVRTATNGLPGGWHAQQWQRFGVTVRAASAVTTIAFVNGDPSGDDDAGLDAVALIDDSPAPGPTPQRMTLARLARSRGGDIR